jgi:hypothetical protein
VVSMLEFATSYAASQLAVVRRGAWAVQMLRVASRDTRARCALANMVKEQVVGVVTAGEKWGGHCMRYIPSGELRTTDELQGAANGLITAREGSWERHFDGILAPFFEQRRSEDQAQTLFGFFA